MFTYLPLAIYDLLHLDLIARTEDHSDMVREINDKKKRKVLRKLRQAAERAQADGGPGLSDWEKEFVEEVEARVEKYGSAFADPDKGHLEEPLSALQTRKLKEIDNKSRGKETGSKQLSGFKSSFKGKGQRPVSPRGRDIHEDMNQIAAPPDEHLLAVRTPVPPKGFKPRLIKASERLSNKASGPKPKRQDTHSKSPEDTTPHPKRPSFQVIKGGKDS